MLAAGLTEDITTAMARFPSLSVAQQSALAFKDSPLDIRQIAERVGARYVIGGSVRKSASGIRIAVHLTDANTAAQLWTDTYDFGRVDGDIFAIQDDVTSASSRRLPTRLVCWRARWARRCAASRWTS